MLNRFGLMRERRKHRGSEVSKPKGGTRAEAKKTQEERDNKQE